jgi:hypothetical protein
VLMASCGTYCPLLRVLSARMCGAKYTFVFWNGCFFFQAVENVLSIGKQFPINPHGGAVLNYECFCTPFNESSPSENINWTSLSKEECLVSNPQICIRACKVLVHLEVHINHHQAC